jgi:tRNA (mo5U34)-methyltransferase
LRKEVEKINWWHKIDFGNGVITPGIDITPEKLKWIQMSQNLAGKSVLDIGAWDGFFHLKQNVGVQVEFLLLIYLCGKMEPK